jgi:8-oxo-dGTP diphosphatase
MPQPAIDVATVGGLLVSRTGRVLLGLRAPWKKIAPNVWDAIGGHVEPGESLSIALVREVREEVGVVPTEFRLLDSIQEKRPDLYGAAVHHIFAVTAWSGGEPLKLSDEHSEIKWFTSTDVQSLPNLAECDYPRLVPLAIACI